MTSTSTDNTPRPLHDQHLRDMMALLGSLVSMIGAHLQESEPECNTCKLIELGAAKFLAFLQDYGPVADWEAIAKQLAQGIVPPPQP